MQLVSRLLVVLAVLLGPRLADADTYVSFNDDATVPHALNHALNPGFLLVEAGDLLNLTQDELLVEEDVLFFGPEDIDGAHVLADGRVLLSTLTDAVTDNTIFPSGSVLRYNPSNGALVEIFRETEFEVAANVDAVFLFEHGPHLGQIVLSTGSNTMLDGLSLRPGDLVRYHLLQKKAALLFDQDLITGTAAQKDIDVVHILVSGSLVLSVTTSGGTLGGLTLEAEDLVEYDPGTDTAVVFLDGAGLWNGTPADLNAASVTEPLPVPAPALPLLGQAILAAALLVLALHLGAASARRRAA